MLIFGLIITVLVLMYINIEPVSVEKFLADDPSKDGGGDMR